VGIPEGVRQVVAAQTFSGPLPHPDIFRKYGEVIPDAPERILRVFEEDSRHVREIGKTALDAAKGDNRRSHWMAFVLIALGLILTGWLAYLGRDVLAGIVATGTLTGTIAGFLTQRADQGKSKQEIPLKT
jgi:uncharacterized membrane protein